MANPTTPKLCRHRAQNQGYVTLNGCEHYLGHWPESRGKKPPPSVQSAYDDLIAVWLANGRQIPEEHPPLSVNEVLLAYLTQEKPPPDRRRRQQEQSLESVADAPSGASESRRTSFRFNGAYRQK